MKFSLRLSSTGAIGGLAAARFDLELTPNDVRALARNWACAPTDLAPKLATLLRSSLIDAIERGKRGLCADRMEAAGDIEVGRNPDELPGIVRGAGAYFCGDRR